MREWRKIIHDAFRIKDKTGNLVDEDNPLYIHTVGEVSTLNSTATPLGIDGVFPGASEDIKDESAIVVTVYSDVASATDGLSIQWSPDGTNWDGSDFFTIPAATQKTFSFQPVARYMKVEYTNGGTGQTEFRLQTLLKASYVKPSSHRINDKITSEDDAELVKAVLTGVDDSGIFENVKVTEDGNLQIVDASDGLAIAENKVTGKTFIHKFGNAPDFDTTDTEVTVWDGANDGGSNLMTYTYSSSADIDRLSSSNSGDTQDIEIQGLDTNDTLTTQTITLTGQTPVALSTSLKRVFRLINRGSTDLAGTCYCFVNVSTTGGVPDTLTNIRAEINNGNNQTLMAIYTIPAGKTGYMRSWFASTAGANRSSNYVIKLKARPTGEVFQLKHLSAVSDVGSSSVLHEYVEPEIFASSTDIEMTVEAKAVGVTGASVSAGFDIVLVDN